MKKHLLLLFIAVAFFEGAANAQFSKYIIRFKHKGTSPYSLSDPSQYLSPRAIARRTRYGIPVDSTDLPITPRFIDSVRLAGSVTILNVSKWMNQVAIQTTDAAALTKINSFTFVISTSPVAPFAGQSITPVNKQLDVPASPFVANPAGTDFTDAYYNYGQSFDQVHIHNGDFLHNRGFRGQDMQLSLMDGGFYHYMSLPTFDSVRNNGQILGTWDFVAGNASVDEDDSHGMKCFSTIAANMPGSFVGTAPKTSFYLFRTEDVNSEYPIEEQNWIAAAERADSLGVDVFSTSLGYYAFDNAAFNHVYADMDGNTTPIAKGADLAAKKGIIAVVAAGNEGTNSWHYIITPADADSVVAVGAVGTDGVVGGFSSYGPSSDGQVKPAVASVGVNTVVANTGNGSPTFGSGTSFACPNMAGLITCLWQAFPEVNNMGIINVLEQSSTKANNPDDRVGYGIPDMKKAFVRLEKQLFTKSVSTADCKTTLQWTVKADSAITINLQRKVTTGAYSLLNTFTSTGGFASKNFSFIDDMNNVAASPVTYRFVMNIASDTTFYLDSVTVNFVPKPNLGGNKTAAVCQGSTFDLTALYTTSGLTTSWTSTTGPVPNPAAITAAGTYRLIAVNTSGCADTVSVTVTSNAKPNLGSDKSIVKCAGSTFDLTTQFVTTGLTTAWTLNGAAVANPVAVTAAGTYQLIVTNTSGCTDTALVVITSDPQPCIPNTDKISISPNPVSNNLFVIISKPTAVKIDILITNAAGQKMYYTSSQQAAGQQTYTVPMRKMADGIYYVTVKINDKEEMVKKVVRQ